MRTTSALLSSVFLFFFITSAGAQQTITLGIPTSLKLLEGAEGNKAAILAVEEINARGGVQVGKEKRLLKVESLDIRDGEPGVPTSEALLGIEKLILDKKIYAAVVGNFRSEALLAAMDIYSKYKVINIGTIAMAPAFQQKIQSDKEKYKYSFRNCLDSLYLAGYMQSMMKFISKEFGYNKVFIATQDVLWAAGTGSMMEKWFKENSWTVVGFDKYPVGASDFSPGLLKAKSAGVQVILAIFDMPTSGILVKQWESMKVPALMAGFISPLMGSKAWKTFGSEIDGVLNVVFEIGYFPIKAYPPTIKFSEAYAKRWKEDIQSGHGAAPAYDSVYVLVDAIEKSGTTDPEKVVKAIQETDMAGVVGKIKFNSGHQLIFGENPKNTACGAVTQWQKGKTAVVWPESIAEAKIQRPAWMK
ncbi:MAG TPA: ABC transporter substrate-binding protein [Syntrophorhabdales bacterium]|nr:ABC transporter substrate-binding protein [Syntrophorhabdales bacterium]